MGARFSLSIEDASNVLGPYGTSAVHMVSPVAEGSVNSTFKVLAQPFPVVITAMERCGFDNDSFNALAAVLDDLASCGAPVLNYLSRGDGGNVSFYRDKPVVVTRYIGGGSLETLSNIPRVTALGRALGLFHHLQTKVEHARIPVWTPPRERLALQRAAMECLFTTRELSYLEGVLDALATVGHGAVKWGLIHADVFPGNVVFESPDQAILIDFEDAKQGPLALDLAIALISCCIDDSRFDHRRTDALLNGYVSSRKLSEPEAVMLPQLIAVACAEVLLGRVEEPTMRLAPRPMFDLLRAVCQSSLGSILSALR